jgi:LPPG:FO 2-phospho-L-lactate transferase
MIDLNIVALAGGVGGAKLVQGLTRICPPDRLKIVVNTGDDFTMFGLSISPDLDTVLYTLAGLANPETGWGIAEDTFYVIDTIGRLGGPDWFKLGDRDLATNLLRTQLLSEGKRFTEVISDLSKTLRIPHRILPMSDSACPTKVLTVEGEMDFQTYFVHRRWQPVVTGFRWDASSTAAPEVLEALEGADLVVICPSNPFVSIDPILMLPGVRDLLIKHTTIAVSPIIGGQAVKGPAAKMFFEMNGEEATSLAVARHYEGLLNGFVLDEVDAELRDQVASSGVSIAVMPTMMPGLEERITVAEGVLAFGRQLVMEARTVE